MYLKKVLRFLEPNPFDLISLTTDKYEEIDVKLLFILCKFSSYRFHLIHDVFRIRKVRI